MQRQTIQTKNAPATGTHLSQATIHNGVVYCSGALPIDPVTNELVGGTIGDRTIRCLKNLEAILIAAGSSLDKVLKVNIFVTNIKDVPAVNEAYTSLFSEPRPARACVEVSGLAKGTDVEIECIGFIGEISKL
ncbi:L-psp endoribonuclease family protein [Grosmannia clavigera kw1407]|uniref:L-psp endoribonuclease family protein n=1 Tax=Grosmannia clavigera (strain kw1407 / UAMH 11150) TaxID=655863 RepID=F0X8Q7_GROCL|nr:L-psp endoribonuclease family protein [Grosmannia clavigera kw1407]EFX05230.1 L-psp endoribonuclease family protein [Grosmannia clavigera kw1407]